MFEPSPQCRLRVEADSPNISSVLVGESGCGFGVAFCFVQASSCFFLFTFAKILCSPICRNFFQQIGLFLQRICLLSLFVSRVEAFSDAWSAPPRLVHRSLETPAISALSARIVPATMLSARRWSDGCCPVPRHHQPFSAVTFRDGCLCNHVPARS